jgi:radical SAM superfamily enzyme YgiQ (UPF0313 family)
LWQAAGTVQSVLKSGLVERAAACGLRSLFVGFETLNAENLRASLKYQNLHKDYAAAIKRLHDNGVMVNASFVFGMDNDDASVFDRTVDWAVSHGIETATFHIMTPYPGTALYQQMQSQNRLLHSMWDLYDTRHVVYKPARLSAEELENGYWRAYREFYAWKNIFAGAWTNAGWSERARHVAYAGGWKKFEPLWDLVIRAKRATTMLPTLEAVLSGFGAHPARRVSALHANANGSPPPLPVPANAPPFSE